MKLSECMAPSFHSVHLDVKSNGHTHYTFPGGRGSCKSSFVPIEIICEMIRHPDTHTVALRQVGETLRDSVYNQFRWAIDLLGVTPYFKFTLSPLTIKYIPTGQLIMFRGADNPEKIKSIKLPFGHIGYVWYEEWNQFRGMEEVRNINQSLARGGSCKFFYTFNPPKSLHEWVNAELLVEREDRLITHTTYLTVPKEWLGDTFIAEAEHLKKVNPEAYEHEYLGIAKGTGGEVFRNVTLRPIKTDEISRFDRVRRGIDWGYAIDPFVYLEAHYDKTRRRLYIFNEIYKVGLLNRPAAELIKQQNPHNNEIKADSAEPKSIAEMWDLGVKVIAARKGPDSVKFGIEWLSGLEEIIIDPDRCPNTAREFTTYELDKDRAGNFKANYPDKDNHTIDAVRYALEDDMRNMVIR